MYNFELLIYDTLLFLLFWFIQGMFTGTKTKMLYNILVNQYFLQLNMSNNKI